MIKKTLILFLISSFNLSLAPMTIDRAILATNNNPDYIEFWPIVAKAWNKMGVRPTLALIGDENVKIDESLGDVIRFKPIPGIPTGYYAQVIRLLLPAYFEEEICITSDIDMLPLSKDFIIGSVVNISEDKFVLYNDKQYEEILQIAPICYLAAKGKTFKEIFQINDIKEIPQLVKY